MRTISEQQWYQWGEDPKRHPPSHPVCSDSEVPLDCRAASFHRLWDSMTGSSWWWWCPDASNCSPAAPLSHSSSHWTLSGYGRRRHSCSLQNECAEDRHRVCLKMVLARRIQSDSFLEKTATDVVELYQCCGFRGENLAPSYQYTELHFKEHCVVKLRQRHLLI